MAGHVTKIILSSMIIASMSLIQSCGSSVGGNEDKTRPVVTLSGIVDANAADDEIIGDATIQWTSDETNKSTVDIYLSNDSGATFTLLANDVPDTGEYTFNTNSIDDCRYCRLRIIARDVVGNESDPAESIEDFIINNVPQVLGVALYVDPDSNGADAGDKIVVPFDKDIEVRTGIASDVFYLPVLGDNIGAYASLGKGTRPNELVITLTDLNGTAPFNGHLHVNKEFDSSRLARTAPSGLNVYDNLSDGVLYARDTGRTASFVAGGIDIIAGFSDPGISLPSPNDGAPIITADLNNDGDLDLIQSSYGGVALNANTGFRVRMGDGSGLFDSGTGLVSGNPNNLNTINNEFCYTTTADCPYIYYMALGDVNSDGYVDLIQGSTGSYDPNSTGWRVWFNNHDGTFTDGGQFYCATDNYGNCSSTYVINFSDVNGDGHIDIIEGTGGAGTRVWINSGAGVFTDSGQRISECNYDDPYTPAACDYYNYANSITTGDVDNDGDVDIVQGNSYAKNQLWLNDGSGIFTDSGQVLSLCDSVVPNQACTAYPYTRSVILTDVENDGDLDLVEAGSAYRSGKHSIANRIWLNSGNGVFTDTGHTLSLLSLDGIAISDLDADGNDDIVTTSYEGTRVLRNSGAGNFTDSGQVLFGGNNIFVGDMDGDSDLDLIVGGYGVRVLLNSLSIPAHYFIDSNQAQTNAQTRAIALGDVDGDGDLDRVEGSYNDMGYGGGGGHVYLNNVSGVAINNGVFTDSNQFLCTQSDAYYYSSSGCSNVNGLALGDVDGDGDLDMVEATQNAGSHIWLNDGTGIFTNSGQALLDCSNSGPLDYMDPNSPIVCYQYYENNDVKLGDIDGDNDLDILVMENYQGVVPWLNNGSGVFTRDVAFGLAMYSTKSVLGNIDTDPGLELILNTGMGYQIWEWDNVNGVMATTNSFGMSYANAMILGDIDNDTDMDLIIDQYGLRIWNNDGNGNFTDSGVTIGMNYSSALALGDVNDDGYLDIVTAGSYNFNELRLNTGSGSFSGTVAQKFCGNLDPNNPSYCSSSTYSVMMGDIDDDGDVDLIQGGNQGASKVWLNDF